MPYLIITRIECLNKINMFKKRTCEYGIAARECMKDSLRDSNKAKK